jgi:SAM-dependent methyltransferase
MIKKRKKPIKLNIGCGENYLDGYVNFDISRKVKADAYLDVRKTTLPFKDGVVNQINCIHNLEHIELKYWEHVLNEFARVLKKGGRLILAYPEFERCAKNFLTNKNGMKDFWRATLYGRQLYPGDYHVVPMVTKDLIELLQILGFDEIKYGPEVEETYNTFLVAKRGNNSLTREDIIRKEVFDE